MNSVLTVTGVTVTALERALPRSWDRSTSSAADWSPANPALGQCAVTALIVQDFFGGDLVRADVGDVSHYWNRLPDGDVDLTRQQFVLFEPRNVSLRDRSYVLSFAPTVERYTILRDRVLSGL